MNDSVVPDTSAEWTNIDDSSVSFLDKGTTGMCVATVFGSMLENTVLMF